MKLYFLTKLEIFPDSRSSQMHQPIATDSTLFAAPLFDDHNMKSSIYPDIPEPVHLDNHTTIDTSSFSCNDTTTADCHTDSGGCGGDSGGGGGGGMD